jgi:hypothetical protein
MHPPSSHRDFSVAVDEDGQALVPADPEAVDRFRWLLRVERESAVRSSSFVTTTRDSSRESGAPAQ